MAVQRHIAASKSASPCSNGQHLSLALSPRPMWIKPPSTSTHAPSFRASMGQVCCFGGGGYLTLGGGVGTTVGGGGDLGFCAWGGGGFTTGGGGGGDFTTGGGGGQLDCLVEGGGGWWWLFEQSQDREDSKMTKFKNRIKELANWYLPIMKRISKTL